MGDMLEAYHDIKTLAMVRNSLVIFKLSILVKDILKYSFVLHRKEEMKRQNQ